MSKNIDKEVEFLNSLKEIVYLDKIPHKQIFNIKIIEEIV